MQTNATFTHINTPIPRDVGDRGGRSQLPLGKMKYKIRDLLGLLPGAGPHPPHWEAAVSRSSSTNRWTLRESTQNSTPVGLFLLDTHSSVFCHFPETEMPTGGGAAGSQSTGYPGGQAGKDDSSPEVLTLPEQSSPLQPCSQPCCHHVRKG